MNVQYHGLLAPGAKKPYPPAMTDQRLHKHGRFFDVWSKFYRRTPLGQQLRKVQSAAVERLHLVSGQVVLDLGCGPGDASEALTRTGAIAIGLDYSTGMLAHAKTQPLLRGRLVRGDAGRLPFRTSSFDKILCANSFHHYPDHLEALREMRRVLKPGGLLVLVDPRRDHPLGWAAIELVEKVLFRLQEVRVFAVPQWRRLLADAGFSEFRVTTGSPLHPFQWPEVFVEARA
jgi:ubiquinone/menaquinone biosynthesis C-methylase UbiE